LRTAPPIVVAPGEDHISKEVIANAGTNPAVIADTNGYIEKKYIIFL